MRRLRVLLSTHEFSPYQGSECAVGWNIATRLAALHDVTVLCADGTALEYGLYSDAVADYMMKNGTIPGLRIVYVRQPKATIRYARLNRSLMSFTGGFGWQPLFYMGLDAWHREAHHVALSLGFDNFDLVHQLTPISFLRPGYLWTTDIPFFWGPLGGMFKVPQPFARLGGAKSVIFECIRSMNIEKQIRMAGFRKTVMKAARIWTITDDEYRIINNLISGKAIPMIDTAPPKDIVGYVRHYDGMAPLKICWSGGHEPRKALPILLHAIAALPYPDKVFLTVLGEGTETHRWKNIANAIGLKNIDWKGRLPYDEALRSMNNSDIFVHTSYREAATMVVLEALGWGLPVICHDACGMAIAVDDSCGIKVPFVNPETSIQGFCDAIDRILRYPHFIQNFSEGALRRASQLSWDAKVQEMSEAYLQYVQ